ncbi:phosphatidylinositol 4-phosphate 3-kinase C2 domain-containing subunit alpha isoform X1 [Hydra vulgaris]|uniref:phosphatidylinositol 4-phosphate 3-kinase C2 domain-containing subunit alpha isoform X1 n=2 Tax=Hydra vulgaris TaxID=6087 RepID=UPI001F5E41AA|nr:phosphatidylinositol 4-phosphate 3-kinase C2 domain-containing subunit alpha-like isoform X1 [Hydra vulgaris]
MAVVGDLIDFSEDLVNINDTKRSSNLISSMTSNAFFFQTSHHLPNPYLKNILLEKEETPPPLPPKVPPPLPPKRRHSKRVESTDKHGKVSSMKDSFLRVNTYSPPITLKKSSKTIDCQKKFSKTECIENNTLEKETYNTKKCFKETLTKLRSQSLNDLPSQSKVLSPIRHRSMESFEFLSGPTLLQSIKYTLRISNEVSKLNKPSRPPPPKTNRFSCPQPNRVTQNGVDMFLDNIMFKKAEERNEEAKDFFKTMNELRSLFRYTDKTTNPGYIKAPQCLNHALNDTIFTIMVHFYTKSQVLTCFSSIKAKEFILKALKFFNTSFNELDILSGQYVLQFAGYSMFADDNVPLCDYVCVQETNKLDKQLEVYLILQEHINTDLVRNEIDDKDDIKGIHFDQFFNNSSSICVTEEGLSVLLDMYNSEASRLVHGVSQTYKMQYFPERLIQVVKAMSTALGCIELLEIQNGVALLLSLKKEMRLTTLQNAEFQNPMHFNLIRFKKALQRLTSGVYSLIELYCKSFNTSFTPHCYPFYRSLPNCSERIDPRTLTDNFSIRIMSVHRIPSNWKSEFTEFELEVSLYYGGKLLCPKRKCSPCNIVYGFFDHLKVCEVIELEIAVKQIPREAKVAISLFGCNQPKRSSDGKTMLGWVSANVYDYQGFLLSGSKLLGLLSNVEFNPVAICATNNIEHRETVIVKIDFQAYHTEVIFPQPIIFDECLIHETNDLSQKELEFIQKTISKDVAKLTKQERLVIWRHRYSLLHSPSALVYILSSAPSWDSESVNDIHMVLALWGRVPPEEALIFLQADFPDKIVRETAVLWLNELTDDDLYDFLPELVQALKYEAYHKSALANFLIKRSLSSPRLTHFLFWHLKYYIGDIQFGQRFKIVLSGLLGTCGEAMRTSLSKQDKLVCMLTDIAKKIKDSKFASRKSLLQIELEKVNLEIGTSFRLPIEPTIQVSHIVSEESSYFNSNTLPLKVVFKNEDPKGNKVPLIFKIGDDLRKDLVTVLMFRVMNKFWINEGFDLKMLLYNVLPTGPSIGFIEMVSNASTFREIHTEHGLTGSFKEDSLALWLQRYNTSEAEYAQAVKTFTASAAAYCVATYLLGIGDRHNDNIMLTRKGHLFHIDFSKFMGAVQMFGGIKRDRVPFVLTPDMAYVINNGLAPTPNFQKFIEYCCNAFNSIRRKKTLVLNLLGLMVYSDISYLSTKEDLFYIEDALQPHLNDDQATTYFTRLIEGSLSSRSTQLNFFIHNVAQIKTAGETVLRTSRSNPLFSFSNKIHTIDEDGVFASARVVDFQKRYFPEKHYVFVINTIRENEKLPSFIFRRYEDFQELHSKLTYTFNVSIALPDLPPKILLGRSQVREVAARRRLDLDKYLVNLFYLEEVWRSNIVHTFLYSYIKDKEEQRRFTDYVYLLEQGNHLSRIGGKIKLSLVYKNDAFHILVSHVKELIPRRIEEVIDCYVKCYLLPDPMKCTKRKTKICRRSLNPTFNDILVYDFLPLELLKKRLLQVSVWEHDPLNKNEFLGGVDIYLNNFNLMNPVSDWFTLTNISLEDWSNSI